MYNNAAAAPDELIAAAPHAGCMEVPDGSNHGYRCQELYVDTELQQEQQQLMTHHSYSTSQSQTVAVLMAILGAVAKRACASWALQRSIGPSGDPPVRLRHATYCIAGLLTACKVPEISCCIMLKLLEQLL